MFAVIGCIETVPAFFRGLCDIESIITTLLQTESVANFNIAFFCIVIISEFFGKPIGHENGELIPMHFKYIINIGTGLLKEFFTTLIALLKHFTNINDVFDVIDEVVSLVQEWNLFKEEIYCLVHLIHHSKELSGAQSEQNELLNIILDFDNEEEEHVFVKSSEIFSHSPIKEGRVQFTETVFPFIEKIVGLLLDLIDDLQKAL